MQAQIEKTEYDKSLEGILRFNSYLSTFALGSFASTWHRTGVLLLLELRVLCAHS